MKWVFIVILLSINGGPPEADGIANIYIELKEPNPETLAVLNGFLDLGGGTHCGNTWNGVPIDRPCEDEDVLVQK